MAVKEVKHVLQKVVLLGIAQFMKFHSLWFLDMVGHVRFPRQL